MGISFLTMKLKSFATNRTLLTFDDGTEVFFSYSTPVAGYNPRLGFVKTKQWYSSTTTRHINKYLNEYCNVPNPEQILSVDCIDIWQLIPIPVRY